MADDHPIERTLPTNAVKKQYKWIITTCPLRQPQELIQQESKWYDCKKQCEHDLQREIEIPYDIPDCWGKYLFYIITKTRVAEDPRCFGCLSK
jgi:hypothetical protein